MQLLVLLAERAGVLVTRSEILQTCWRSAPVGEDSLNRVVAALRKALTQTTAGAVRIDTVPGVGYVLRLGFDETSNAEGREGQIARVLELGEDSWRMGLPRADYLAIEELRNLCAAQPDHARAWGLLALLLRHAAEYEEPAAASVAVRECQRAARQAISLDPHQPEALTALTSVVPLFGGWGAARSQLIAILAATPDHPVPLQDLATLEMATGRTSAGKEIRDRLIAQDPLAAVSCYKSVYQHWAVNDLAGMDHVADRSMHLWPTHPAVWTVRLWTYAYTERPAAALRMLDDDLRPSVPAGAIRFLKEVLLARKSENSYAADAVVQGSREHAKQGPASAVQAMFALGLFDRLDDLFAIAEAYYLRNGDAPVPMQHSRLEPALNEQHRRLTQVLFTPVFAKARRGPRFVRLCERIGLVRYWSESGMVPDFTLDHPSSS